MGVVRHKAAKMVGHLGDNRVFWEEATICFGSLKNFGVQIVKNDSSHRKSSIHIADYNIWNKKSGAVFDSRILSKDTFRGNTFNIPQHDVRTTLCSP
jgi:hypothetical protein